MKRNHARPIARPIATSSLAVALLLLVGIPCAAAESLVARLASHSIHRGLVVVSGEFTTSEILRLAQPKSHTMVFLTRNEQSLQALQNAAYEAGLWGRAIYGHTGGLEHIPLENQLADAVVVSGNLQDIGKASRDECLRVLRPGGVLLSDDGEQVKPCPNGADDWSHPYHGPDNNPVSKDRLARAPLRTQFLAPPWYVPMPQVTVAAGGRLFKAFGHIALKQREWPWLNQLVAINGYNGTLLWQRRLKPGFMIHRNTLIATPERLYLGDDESCKVLDSATGELLDNIVIPDTIDPDGVWKWMALADGTLYAMLGEQEPAEAVIRGTRAQSGWPWNGLGPGYAGPYRWGFGRVIVAMNPGSHEVLWTYRSELPLDSRATCLADGRIFTYSHQQQLTCLDALTGRAVWQTDDPALLEAIGPHDRAQTAPKGFSSSAYMKANDRCVFFAGPQRKQLVAVDAKTGELLWTYPDGNLQLILRDDGLYALARTQTSKVFDYRTGKVLRDLGCYRGNCTRATATPFDIFTRGYRHTGSMRYNLEDHTAHRIAMMRPACQDGVIAAGGLLYWGPWMCDCNHSLLGIVALAASDDREPNGDQQREPPLRQLSDATPRSFPVTDDDWPAYRHDAVRSGSSPVTLSLPLAQQWQWRSPSGSEPTAAIAAGDLAWWGSKDGAVTAVDVASGDVRWQFFTGGALVFPPELHRDRLLVGSGDGYLYCLAPRDGTLLWKRRMGPDDHRLPVYGRLISRWPLSGGVLTADGRAYVAAGLTSYDGTHVAAVNVADGSLVWHNDESGHLIDEAQPVGVSVQGHLLLHDDKLYLAGGNVVSPAVYDIHDGQCLNELDQPWWRRPRDARELFPSRPESTMFYRSPRGRELFLVGGKVMVSDPLLYAPPHYIPSRYFDQRLVQAHRDDLVVRATHAGAVALRPQRADSSGARIQWKNASFTDPAALVLTHDAAIIAARHATAKAADAGATAGPWALAVLDLKDGHVHWSVELPSPPITSGLAVNRDGTIIVSLSDGLMLGWGAR